MTTIQGTFNAPKSLILKLNSTININSLSNLSFALLKNNAVIDLDTLDKMTSLTSYEQDYEGYSRKTVDNIIKNNVTGGYLWTATDVIFLGLYATVRYGIIFNTSTNDIIAVMDLGQDFTFAGDITFGLSVYGFLEIKRS